jgi:hypothetical protein
LKFKRKAVKADAKVLELCTARGINATDLTNKLKSGILDGDTTAYFFALYPLKEKPDVRPLLKVLPPIKPGARHNPIPKPSGGMGTERLDLHGHRNDSLPQLVKLRMVVAPKVKNNDPMPGKRAGSSRANVAVPLRMSLPRSGISSRR